MATSGDRQVLTTNTKTAARNFVGPVRVSLTGNFGGGTFKMEAEDPSGVFVDIDGSVQTTAIDFIIDFPDSAENKIQGDLSGATAPALVIWNQGVDRGA